MKLQNLGVNQIDIEGRTLNVKAHLKEWIADCIC